MSTFNLGIDFFWQPHKVYTELLPKCLSLLLEVKFSAERAPLERVLPELSARRACVSTEGPQRTDFIQGGNSGRSMCNTGHECTVQGRRTRPLHHLKPPPPPFTRTLLLALLSALAPWDASETCSMQRPRPHPAITFSVGLWFRFVFFFSFFFCFLPRRVTIKSTKLAAFPPVYRSGWSPY